MLFGSLLSYAQGICRVATLKVDGIAGRVEWNDRTHQPIAKTRLKLLDAETNDAEKPLASFVTGEDGRFAFKNLTKGKYILAAKLFVDESPMFEFRAVFDVRKSKGSRIRSFINMKLGSDCWRSDVSVRKK
jgi:hypothetical protein